MDAVMSNFYTTLLKLKYPEITKASPKDLHSTIFTGQSRVSLLAWLLSRKSAVLASTLEKLEGIELEDELVRYYTGLGVCNDKDSLLGKCTLEEDLVILSVLHEFVKNVFEPASAISDSTDESMTDIVKTYITDGTSSSFSLCNIGSKLSYSNATAYIESVQKNVSNMIHTENESTLSSTEASSSNEENKETDSTNPEEVLTTEKEDFIKAFTFVSSWHISKSATDDSTSMDHDIKNISSKFSLLKQTLEAKEEISKMILPNKLPETYTPLNSMIENIVIRLEELKSTDENSFNTQM